MSTRATATAQEVLKVLAAREAALIQEYLELVRIPSVSADPMHAADVQRCAERLAERMRSIGLAEVRVDQTPGHPIVTAASPPRGGAPTYLVYAHYDVQPAEPLGEWETEPFEPAILGDEFRGRGVSDDKAHVHLHLAVAEAYLALGGLPVNLRFVFEGAEEISSQHFDEWLATQEWLSDLEGCVVSDTTFLTRDQPSLGTGVRGLLYLEVDVRTAAADLHSGGYGGGVANAADVLTRLLAGLKDASGRVTVPGFYDDATSDETFRATLQDLPFDQDGWLEGAGLVGGQPVGEPGYSLLERLWLRPTFDINGVWSGHTGDGPKTIIPSEAHAKLSCRLVPDQDPDAMFALLERAILDATPTSASATVRRISGSRAARVDPTSTLARASVEALRMGFQRQVVLQREGGSIPVVGLLADRLPGVPIVLLGFSPPDDAAHAPNERMRRWNYDGGLATLAHLWQLLGQTPGATSVSHPGQAGRRP